VDQAGETAGPGAEKGTVSFKNMIGTQYYRATYAALQGYVSKMNFHTAVPCDPTTTEIVPSTPMVALITAQERLHQALAVDPNFHAMSLISTGTVLCIECQTSLSAYCEGNGVDTTFMVARKLQLVASGLAPVRY
jgi:hypothetical protein